jgi:hypothetical protein
MSAVLVLIAAVGGIVLGWTFATPGDQLGAAFLGGILIGSPIGVAWVVYR